MSCIIPKENWMSVSDTNMVKGGGYGKYLIFGGQANAKVPHFSKYEDPIDAARELPDAGKSSVVLNEHVLPPTNDIKEWYIHAHEKVYYHQLHDIIGAMRKYGYIIDSIGAPNTLYVSEMVFTK